MNNPPSETVPVSLSPKLPWVWRSTDASIEGGQFSKLAVIETFLIVLLYGWIIWYFDMLWWWLLIAEAAPLILLRSEESKALGVALLKAFENNPDYDDCPVRNEKLLLIVLVSVVTAILCYWLAAAWLSGRTGWVLWWHTVVLAVTVLVFEIAFVSSGWLALAFAVMAAAVSISVGVGVGMTVGVAVALTFAAMFVYTAAKGAVGILAKKVIFLPFFALFFGLCMWLRGLGIRIYATLRHPIAGLYCLPHNFREIMFMVDFLHPPELLPGASQVRDVFSVAGLLTKLRAVDADSQIVYRVLIPPWYLPALLWRWSLKTTILVWWPLALLLRPPLDGWPNERIYERAKMLILLAVLVSGIGLMVEKPISSISQYWMNLKDWMGFLGIDISKYIDVFLAFSSALQPGPILYALTLLYCVLVLFMCAYAYYMKWMHTQILNEEVTFSSLGDDSTDKMRFIQRTRLLQRYFIAQEVIFILLVYAVLLWFGRHYYPLEISHFIPAWLLDML